MIHYGALRAVLTARLVAGAAGLLCLVAGCDRPPPRHLLAFDTEYQAVFLTNGQVFFGKLEDADQPFPRLRDVYYLQTQVNQQTNQVANVLYKRGGELHAPDLMYVNSRQVLVIEPVGRDSRIAQLIAEARRQQAGGPPAAPGAPPAPAPALSAPAQPAGK